MIESPEFRSVALAEVAAALADLHEPRAVTLFDAAEAKVAKCVRPGSSHDSRQRAFWGVANAMADSDPVRAERVGRAAGYSIPCDRAFVTALDARHPHRAEAFVLAAPNARHRLERAFALAERRAAGDPREAERIAALQPSTAAANLHRLDLVRTLVGVDVPTAERVASAIEHPKIRALALAELAPAIAAAKPWRAARLLRKAARAARSVRGAVISGDRLHRILELGAVVHPSEGEGGGGKAAPRFMRADEDWVLETTAVRSAAVDQQAALRAAGRIGNVGRRHAVFVHMAERAAASDPDAALRLVAGIEDRNGAGKAWRALVVATAAVDGARAERILRAGHRTQSTVRVAADVARVLADRDPWHAERVALMAGNASGWYFRDDALAAVAAGWARLARAGAAGTDPINTTRPEADSAAVQDAIPAGARPERTGFEDEGFDGTDPKEVTAENAAPQDAVPQDAVPQG